uniref:MOFRL domain-containing protein n=1 Tax=Anopheles merus TaxID=30066 RepID=A0A182VIY2_ANOME
MEEFISQAVDGNKEKPLLIVGAGEPTVCVSGGGKGGRNQELALRFTVGVRELERVPDSVCFLSAGTDGIDGPTDVAGAIGGAFVAREFEETFHLAEAKTFLERNDSYRFYEAVSSGQYFVKTGHTAGPPRGGVLCEGERYVHLRGPRGRQNGCGQLANASSTSSSLRGADIKHRLVCDRPGALIVWSVWYFQHGVKLPSMDRGAQR